MNYTELVQAIKDYVESTETAFVAQIPTFVRQTEEKIARLIANSQPPIPELRKNVTGALVVSDPYLARPADFLSVFSLAVIDSGGAYSYLVDKDVNFLREAYPNPTTSGIPRFYAQFDGVSISGGTPGNFLLAPTPDVAYAVELHYYFDPPSIVDSATSWLGNNAETALLNGALIEAYTFLKGDESMMQMYREQFVIAMQALGVVVELSKRDSYRRPNPLGGSSGN